MCNTDLDCGPSSRCGADKLCIDDPNRPPPPPGGPDGGGNTDGATLPLEQLARDLDMSHELVVVNTTVFMTVKGSIFSCPTTGCAPPDSGLTEVAAKPIGIAASLSSLYFTRPSDGAFSCDQLDCTTNTPRRLGPAGNARAIFFLPAGSSVYWVTTLAGGTEVWRGVAGMPTSNALVASADAGGVSTDEAAIRVSGKNIYWTSGGNVYAVPTDLTTNTPLLLSTAIAGATRLALSSANGGELFWNTSQPSVAGCSDSTCGGDAAAAVRVEPDTNETEAITAIVAQPTRLVWAEKKKGDAGTGWSIVRCSLPLTAKPCGKAGGGGATAVASGDAGEVAAMVLDVDTLYFLAEEKLFRIGLGP